MADPIIYGTPKEYAWDAWQRAFGSIGLDGLPLPGSALPDHKAFETWFNDFGLTVQWKDMREMFGAAWGKGVQDRNEQSTRGFNAWWQAIVDAQPVTT